MSNYDAAGVDYCSSDDLGTPLFDILEPREAVLTPRKLAPEDGSGQAERQTVWRFLPNKEHRMVGAWCFVDYYGPDVLGDGAGMQIAPHPHCGLQTVSWLMSGLVHHTDSIGSDCLVEPGHVGLMTAGHGIAHAERSPANRPPILHGAQLWVALPKEALDAAPAFQHVEKPPAFTHDGVIGTVIIGEYGGAHSPATAYTPLVGVDFDVPGNERTTLPLRRDFEYAVLVTKGYVDVEDHPMKQGEMVFLGSGRDSFTIQSELGARLLLLGGEPFGEEIVMWWNFVGRTHEDIERARADWMEGDRFGNFPDPDPSIPAPPIPSVRLKPRGRLNR